MNLWPFRRRRDTKIDSMIRPPRYTFTGHDEAMERRARERREQADRVRRVATRIDTQDRPKLHRVS